MNKSGNIEHRTSNIELRMTFRSMFGARRSTFDVFLFRNGGFR